jgi:hypothetical protein
LPPPDPCCPVKSPKSIPPIDDAKISLVFATDMNPVRSATEKNTIVNDLRSKLSNSI